MSVQILYIKNYISESGHSFDQLELSYEIFGKTLSEKHPIVLTCHALTGNSKVAGEYGWWNGIIGENKLIDLNQYSILSFNLPGNGFTGKNSLIADYKELTTRDLANLLVQAIQSLGLEQLHSVIGGSLGGMIVWELATHYSSVAQHFIPIASDYKSSDWVIAQNFIQKQIIDSSENGLELARQLSMLFYRTPSDYKRKFNRTIKKNEDERNVESYLVYQGQKLKKRMTSLAYKTMTHYLSSCSIAETPRELAKKFKQFTGKIHIIGITSDLLFPAIECRKAFESLDFNGVSVSYNEINSEYGHDAFLIEYEQLTEILTHVFTVDSPLGASHFKHIKQPFNASIHSN